MKNIFFNLFALTCFLFMAGCSSEDFTHPDQNGIPKATDIKAEVSVDQTTNIVTFKIDNQSNNPVWFFNDGKVSTVNGCTKVYTVAGTYSVEIKMSNANGISEGSVVKQFTINNSLIDFAAIYNKIAGTSSKQWVWDAGTAGHIACGPSGSDGTSWYSAKPNEKAAFELYDDVLTFNSDKSYTYDPGEGGHVFVNTSCTIFKEYNNGSDFMAPVSKQTASWAVSVEGNDLYLVFPAKTMIGYIPNDEAYNNPKFRILSLSENSMELVSDNGTIAWHFALKTKAV